MKLLPYSSIRGLLAFALIFLPATCFLYGQQVTETLVMELREGSGKELVASSLEAHFVQYQLLELEANWGSSNGLPGAFSLTVSDRGNAPQVWQMHRNTMRATDYQMTLNGVPTQSVGSWTCTGSLLGVPGSEARLSLFPGAVTGYFQVGGETHFIEPLANLIPQTREGRYIAYRAQDVVPGQIPFCMSEEVAERSKQLLGDLDKDHDHEAPTRNSPNGGRHSAPNPNPTPIPQTEIAAGDVVSNCFFLELATEADYEWYTDFGSSVPASIAAIDAILNQVEGLYCSNFNLSFRLTNQNVHTLIADPYTSTTLLNRLFEFRTLYTTIAPYNTFARDLGHMFTGTNLAGSAVGYAFVGVVCSYGSGFGITQHYNAGTFGQVVIAAHELGHNFSSPHSTSVSCGALGSVMCPYVQTNSFYFSPATVTQINGHIGSRSCLGPPDLSLTPLFSTLCIGPNVTFTATFNSNYTYQWYRDSIAIPGANGNSHLDSIPGYYIVDIGNYDTTCTSCTVSLVASLSGSSVIVTNTNDSGPGSLRDAIINANSCPGWDTILFNIPGAGPHQISPLSALPAISDTVFIDGYSQPGAASATATTTADLRIILDGSAAGNASGLVVNRTPDCKIAGLCINDWSGFGSAGSGILLVGTPRTRIVGNYLGTDVGGVASEGNRQSGILLQDSCRDVHIGGTLPADLNLVSGNESSGIFIDGRFPAIPRTLIEGNFIGTDITGTLKLSNETGIQVEDADSTQIGGTLPGAENLISGNRYYGIELGANGERSIVEGNLIGTDVTGQLPLGNGGIDVNFIFGAGIHLNSGFNRIGGGAPEMRNVISANTRGIYQNPAFGAQQTALSFDENVIQGNHIGIDITGTLPLGNNGSGILFIHSSSPGGTTGPPPSGFLENHTVGGLLPGEENIIAYNGYGPALTQPYDSAGIAFHAFSTPNSVRGNTKIFRNQIYQNGGLGIFITPNALQGPPEYKPPVLVAAILDCSSQTTTVSGDLIGNDPSTDYRIEYFYNLFPDPSGMGEGEVFIGSDSVLTDAIGNVSFAKVFPAMSIPSGACIAATATALDTGNTSMFSNNVCLTYLPLAYPAPDSIDGCEGDPIFLVDFNPAIDVTYTIPGVGVVTSDTLIYLTPSPGDVIIIQATDTCGRYFIDTIPLNITPPLPLDLGPDTILCPGDNLLLFAGSGWASYQWQDNSGNPTFNALSSGDYEVEITDSGGCRARDTLTILVEGPLVDLGADTVFCSGGILDAGSEAGWTYQWLPGGSNQYEAVDSAGAYEVIITDSNGCVVRDTINITLDSVFVNLGNDTLLADVDSLHAGNLGCSYTWSNGETTATIIPVTPGLYQVTVTCPSGCSYVDEIELVVPLNGQQVQLHAQAESGGIGLVWVCEGLDCTHRTALERQTPAGVFEAIWLGAGDSSSEGDFLDLDPHLGSNRYRVRITDQSGKVHWSNVTSAWWEGEQTLTVSPIPAQDELHLDWKLTSERAQATLYDALGKVVWQQQIIEKEGTALLDCASWARGMYWMRVISGDGTWEKQLPVLLR